MEGTNTLSNSPSETGSDVDSGNFSLRGEILSKTSPPREGYQKKIAHLIQLLRKIDESIKLKQDIITNQNQLLEAKDNIVQNNEKVIQVYKKQLAALEENLNKNKDIMVSCKEAISENNDLYEKLENKEKLIQSLQAEATTMDVVIQVLEWQLEAKGLLMKNVQLNDSSSKELLSEMENLRNQNYKIKSY